MSKPANPELIQKILDIAMDELGRNPPERINMRHIAERAGVSATAIYYYFSSKEALFERIKLDAMAELDSRVAEAASREPSPRKRIAAFIRAYAAWCLERYNLARLLMDELPPSLDLDEEAMRKYYSVIYRARDLVEDAIAKGEIEGRDALLEVSFAQSAIWGIVSLHRNKRIHPDFWDSPDPLIERYIATALGREGG